MVVNYSGVHKCITRLTILEENSYVEMAHGFSQLFQKMFFFNISYEEKNNYFLLYELMCFQVLSDPRFSPFFKQL